MIEHESSERYVERTGHAESIRHNGRMADSYYEDDDIGHEPEFKGMKKLTPRQQKKFPDIVVDSMLCQAYYTARCETCKGCDCAIDGCEKVVYMPAG